MNIEEMRTSLKTIMPDAEVDALNDEEARRLFADHFSAEGGLKKHEPAGNVISTDSEE